MQDHVCASPHRSSRVTSFRRFAGAMSAGRRWPRMPGLVRHRRLGRGNSTRWAARQMPTTGSLPKRAQPVGCATGSASLRRLSTLWHAAEGSASAVIAAPDHLGRRGMNPAVRHQERHADTETKAGPDTALPRPPVVPPGLRQWDTSTSRDISLAVGIRRVGRGTGARPHAP